MALSLARWYGSELPSARSLSPNHALLSSFRYSKPRSVDPIFLFSLFADVCPPACLRTNATHMVPTQLSLAIPAGLRGKLGGRLELRPYSVYLRGRLSSSTIWRSTNSNFSRASLLSYHSMNLPFPLEFQLFIFPIHPKPFSELPSSASPPSLTPPVHKACPPKPHWQFASSLPCPLHPCHGPAMSLILRVFALVISRMVVIVKQLLAHRVISGVLERAWPRFPRQSGVDPSCQCQASPALAHCFMIYVMTRASRMPVPSAASCAALCSARSARDYIHLPMPHAWTHRGSSCCRSKSIYPQRFVVQGLEERTRPTVPSQDMHPLVF
ncbi:hypothetical protein GGF50DRAFT_100703 [Schizophyllum commune]